MIRYAFPVLVLLMLPAAMAAAQARPPLRDPVALNIGVACQWQQKCMSKQKRAMKRALKYVRKSDPPVWRIQACNRNASRGRFRVDWIGFNNCIRNASIRPAPPRPLKRRSRTTR
ncbi:MAG TPA: hypothetical protein VFP57_01120 [Sphingomicrobium sp.]|jgi:hypothetical protein|nr:hypothetical protein [Sphingomicrobium sp.]